VPCFLEVFPRGISSFHQIRHRKFGFRRLILLAFEKTSRGIMSQCTTQAEYRKAVRLNNARGIIAWWRSTKTSDAGLSPGMAIRRRARSLAVAGVNAARSCRLSKWGVDFPEMLTLA